MSVNFFLRSLVVALLVTASASAVTVTWVGSVSSDWTVPTNWDTGVLPGTADVAVINAVVSPNFAPVVSSTVNTTSTRIGTLTLNGKLTITSSGFLAVSNFGVSSGWDLTVNGTFDAGTGKTFYLNGPGTFTIDGPTAVVWMNRRPEFGLVTVNVKNGGTFNQSGDANLITGRASAAPTTINVDSGSRFLCRNSSGGTTLYNRYANGVTDVAGGGLFRITNTMTAVTNWKNGGYFISSNPRERVTLTQYSTYQVDVTAVLQEEAWNPVPVDNGPNQVTMTLVPLGSVPVSWTAPIARDDTDTIECRVYANFDTGTYDVDANGFPTDPNGDDLPLYTTIMRPAATSITVTSVVGGRYQWRVDSVDNSVDPLVDPNYPIINQGPTWYFKTGNAPPVADAGATQILGIVGGAAAFVSDASITDDGLPVGQPVTGQWTQLDGPTTVAGLPASVTAASPNVTLNITQAGRYRFQLIPYDTALYGTASIVQANVYSDSCLAAKAGTWTAMQGDFNDDCKVSAADLSLMVADWLRCTDTISGCN